MIMKSESRNLTHAIWMLSNATKCLASAIDANENEWETTIEWLTAAIDSMAEAEKAIEETKLLPF